MISPEPISSLRLLMEITNIAIIIFLALCSIFVYRIFATPIIWFYLTFIRRVKYVNRKALKRCKSGYFIYGNHTQSVVDAFNPAMLARPHRASIIVSPDAVSVPGLNMFIPILGGIPIPSTLQSTKNYLKYLKYLVSKKELFFFIQKHTYGLTTIKLEISLIIHLPIR